MKHDHIQTILQQLKDTEGLKPSHEFRTNARIRLLNQLPDATTVVPQQTPFPRVLRWLASLGTAIALAGTGVVYAAQGSTPGTPLYPIKVKSEQVATALAPTKNLKTEVVTGIIDRRASEIEHLDETKKDKELPKALHAYEKTVEEATRTSRVSHEEVDSHIETHKDYIHDVTNRIQDDADDDKKLPEINSSQLAEPTHRSEKKEEIKPTETPAPTLKETPEPTNVEKDLIETLTRPQ